MVRPTSSSDEPAKVEKAFTLRWSWLGLAFSFTERKLVIARQRRLRSVHLTLSYANASGEIDLHLKREPAPPGEDQYVSLGRIGPERLARLGEHFNQLAQRLAYLPMDHWRPVRPGWLSRRGYALMLIPKDVPAGMFAAFVPSKRRGKHQLTFAPLKDPAYQAQFADCIYDAAILPHLDAGALQLPVTAVSLRARRGPLLVAPFTVNGSTQWYMMPRHRMMEIGDRLGAEVAIYIGNGLHGEHARAFDRICDELGLSEIPELAEFVTGVRESLAAPLDTVQKAKSKLRAFASTRRPHPKSLTRRVQALYGSSPVPTAPPSLSDGPRSSGLRPSPEG